MGEPQEGRKTIDSHAIKPGDGTRIVSGWVLYLTIPALLGALASCWAGMVFAERGRQIAELNKWDGESHEQQWARINARLHEENKDNPAVIIYAQMVDKALNEENRRREEERAAKLKTLDPNFFTACTDAVYSNYWQGVGTSAGFLALLGFASWGLRGFGEAKADVFAPTAGFGPVGGILGAILGALGGLVAGLFTNVLPLGVWFAFYGLLFGIGAGVTLALIPSVKSL
jgi:hypothetical protein